MVQMEAMGWMQQCMAAAGTVEMAVPAAVRLRQYLSPSTARIKWPEDQTALRTVMVVTAALVERAQMAASLFFMEYSASFRTARSKHQTGNGCLKDSIGD